MKPSKENDLFFLSLIEDNKISIDPYGVVINLNTNKTIGFVTGGYKRINMYGKTAAVNRLVYLTYVASEIPEDFVIDHKDGNKLNNYFENLEAVSYSVNNKRAFELNLHPPASEAKSVCKIGVKNPRAKFTIEEVLLYRTLYDQGAKISELAAAAKVLPKAMSMMLKKQTYTDI